MTIQTKVRHTAGPWELDREYPDEINGPKKRGIAEVHGGRFVSSVAGGPADVYEIPDEVMANAQLIAAAPDLLEACKDILDFLKRNGYDTAIVKAAIQKAEGEL